MLLFAKDGGFGVSSILQKFGCAQAALSCPGLAAGSRVGRLSTERRVLLGVCAVYERISVPGPWCTGAVCLTEQLQQVRGKTAIIL